MAGQITTKTFHGGMNKDIDISLLKENEYIHAENYNLVADEASNGYILENAEGNDIWLDLSSIAGLSDSYYMVGSCFIKPYLVLFYTTVDGEVAPTGGTSVIVRVTLDGDKIQEASVIYTDGVDNTYLALSTTYPINAVGYYEGPNNVKVYWTDNYNPVRGMNIMDDSLVTYTAGMLELTPNFPLSSSVQPRPTIIDLQDGNLPVCSIQYSYQYYLNEGAQTLWAPASKIQMIPVNNNTASSIDYIGGDEGEKTKYGVRFSIAIPSENLYPKMRIIAIQYNGYNQVPEIRIIREQTLVPGVADTLTFIDIGSSISELSYEEFVIQNNSTYRAKDLAIKDNRLFLANIKESSYDVDFDARAYRHNSGGTARIYESNLSSYIDISSFSSVPEDHDCINLFNDMATEDTSEYQFMSDGTTLGAEGENMTIEIVRHDDLIDILGDSDILGSTANLLTYGATSVNFMAGNKSFQRTEVYRLGIIFRNEKMQTSPVKWMCDFKMPRYDQDAGYYRYAVSIAERTYATRMGLKVTMANFPASDAKTWEVVVVPRETGDRCIQAQGIIQPSWEDVGPEYQIVTRAMHPEDVSGHSDISYDPVSWFHSPEISFNRNLEFKTNDILQKVGTLYISGWASGDSILNEEVAFRSKHYKIFRMTAEGTYVSTFKQDLLDAKIIEYQTNADATVTLYNEAAKAYCDANLFDCPIGTALAFEIDGAWDTDFIDESGSGTEVVIANYRRNVFASQYGGLAYNNRELNEYISASDPRFTSTSVSTYEGDTFIDFFYKAVNYIDIPLAIEGVTNTGYASYMFPVESSICTRISHSDYVYRHVSSAKHRLTQEIAGDWEGDVPFGGTTWTYTQEEPLFLYNAVYSQLPKANIFIADSEQFEENTVFPTRIMSSNKKTNNETLDSFSRFGINEFLDVDGSKGKLQNVKTFRNKLFFWQDTGFGIASVNTRALITDNNPGALVLGTGTVLERYDYISDNIGNQNQFGIAISRTALYWVDNNKSEFFKYDGKVESITKLGGVQTWINELGEIGDAKVVYDHKYNDVIFTVIFSREFVRSAYGGGVRFTMEDTIELTNDILYNSILHARYPSTYMYPERNVVWSPIGQPTTWILETEPYTEVGAAFNITLDRDPTRTHTITFSERINKFTSYNSFTPGRYIETDYGYYSTDDYHDLYQHNDKDAGRATYFGTTYDSIITTSFNDNYPYTKVWDSMKWITESFDSSKISQFTDTFQNVEMYNNYQNTGDRILVVNTTPIVGETELTRREQTWSMAIPRNIVNDDISNNPDIHDVANHDETQIFKERMRDKYLTCNFTYDNDDGYTFSIPLISIIYRKSVR